MFELPSLGVNLPSMDIYICASDDDMITATRDPKSGSDNFDQVETVQAQFGRVRGGEVSARVS